MLVFMAAVFAFHPSTHAILAGGEFALPSDAPSSRLDTEGAYNFVGVLEISAGGYLYRGSAIALSPNEPSFSNSRKYALAR
jgi:hypothetical protein